MAMFGGHKTRKTVHKRQVRRALIKKSRLAGEARREADRWHKRKGLGPIKRLKKRSTGAKRIGLKKAVLK